MSHCFNPHRARRPGATGPRRRLRFASGCFNPHRARRPGATSKSYILVGKQGLVSILTGPGGPVLRSIHLRGYWQDGVSILTGPGGPVLPLNGPEVGPGPLSFQSSPGPEARCYQGEQREGEHDAAVSILTGPGGPVLPAPLFTVPPGSTGFNPHRARRPGATRLLRSGRSL